MSVISKMPYELHAISVDSSRPVSCTVAILDAAARLGNDLSYREAGEAYETVRSGKPVVLGDGEKDEVAAARVVLDPEQVGSRIVNADAPEASPEPDTDPERAPVELTPQGYSLALATLAMAGGHPAKALSFINTLANITEQPLEDADSPYALAAEALLDTFPPINIDADLLKRLEKELDQS